MSRYTCSIQYTYPIDKRNNAQPIPSKVMRTKCNARSPKMDHLQSGDKTLEFANACKAGARLHPTQPP